MTHILTVDIEKEDGKEMYDGEVPAYQFDSEGAMDVDLYEGEELCCEQCGSTMKEGECEECGSMYEEVDEDLRESFIEERQRINEMFDRFKKFL